MGFWKKLFGRKEEPSAELGKNQTSEPSASSNLHPDPNFPSNANAPNRLHPPLPLILIAGRNPDAKAVFGPLFDSVASECGIFRSDFIDERWNPSRSLKTIRMDTLDNIDAQQMLGFAVQNWGEDILVGLNITTVRLLPLESLMLVAAAAQSSVPDDRSGYWAPAFPRVGDFSFSDEDFGLDWSEDLARWNSIRSGINSLIVRYPANYQPVRRPESIRFSATFRTGAELTTFMKELIDILTAFGFARDPAGWDRWSHDRYFNSWVWGSINIKGQSYRTICTDCVGEKLASSDAD